MSFEPAPYEINNVVAELASAKTFMIAVINCRESKLSDKPIYILDLRTVATVPRGMKLNEHIDGNPHKHWAFSICSILFLNEHIDESIVYLIHL